jgi:hypothetical protein
MSWSWSRESDAAGRVHFRRRQIGNLSTNLFPPWNKYRLEAYATLWLPRLLILQLLHSPGPYEFGNSSDQLVRVDRLGEIKLETSSPAANALVALGGTGYRD